MRLKKSEDKADLPLFTVNLALRELAGYFRLLARSCDDLTPQAEEWGVPLATERFWMAVRGELNLLEIRRPEEAVEAAQAQRLRRTWRHDHFVRHVLPDLKGSPNTVGNTPQTAHGLSPTRRGAGTACKLTAGTPE